MDPSQPPFDNSDDTLVGFQNNGKVPVSSLPLSGSGIPIPPFAFDGDGICSGAYGNWAGSAGCPYDQTGYGGPGVSFSNISSDQKSATVNFSPAIPPKGFAYFSLEGPTSSIVPAPSTTPTLVITPTIGPSGNTTSAIGTGFPANSTVSLRWDHGVTPTDLDQVATDATGGFTVQILILPHDVLGRRTLKATAAPGTRGSPTASASYLVVPGSGQPPKIGVGSGDDGDGLVLRR